MLTKEQWYDKLKALVPDWVFQEQKINKAIFLGLAKALSEAQRSAEDHVSETFFDNSSNGYLLQHGKERNIDKLYQETDYAYSQRIKYIINKSNLPALKNIVDALLINGECQIIEHYNTANFLNRNAFLNRNIINFLVGYNAFTIIVSEQIPTPTFFLNREGFANRESFLGSNESSMELFDRIVSAVNISKALGTVYRLIERTG